VRLQRAGGAETQPPRQRLWRCHERSEVPFESLWNRSKKPANKCTHGSARALWAEHKELFAIVESTKGDIVLGSQTASGINAAHCHAINFNVVAMPIKVLVYS
jgi:hypothetical protein